MTLANNTAKITRRRAFLETCTTDTCEIHGPIADPSSVYGHLNPIGLGNAAEFSRTTGFGQSSVAFESVKGHEEADRTGRSPHGSAEYAVVQTSSGKDLCEKIAQLHRAVGAVNFICGLAAIAIALDTFNPLAIAVPDCVYGPMLRFVNYRNQKLREFYLKFQIAHHASQGLADNLGPLPEIQIHRYSSGASADEMENLLNHHSDIDLIYLEVPGSQTFEIPDIHGIVRSAQARGIRTVMDNTWASHVRFRPLQHGIDVVIQATTKYEGGYADTPSGVVIAAKQEDLEIIQKASRVWGAGAVNPGTCMRLYHRVDSTAERMDQHYATALELMNWFAKQDFVAEILCPARPESPSHERFHEYFGGKGNGLFTIVFKEDITEKQVHTFIDAMLLFRIFESWGGHVSGALPAHPQRELSTLPKGQMVRFHAGLETPIDLLCDLEQAKAQVFPPSAAAGYKPWHVSP